MPFGNAYCGLCAVENFKAAIVKPEEKGGVNDFWHIAQKHNDQDSPSGPWFEIVNYARHERVDLYGATRKRAEDFCTLLNAQKF